jgi:hypothetical protein
MRRAGQVASLDRGLLPLGFFREIWSRILRHPLDRTLDFVGLSGIPLRFKELFFCGCARFLISCYRIFAFGKDVLSLQHFP